MYGPTSVSEESCISGASVVAANSAAAPCEHDYQCAVCFSLLFDPVVAPCGHDACHNCMLTWRKRQSKSPTSGSHFSPLFGTPANYSCPICRAVLPNTELKVCNRYRDMLCSIFPTQMEARRKEEAERMAQEAEEKEAAGNASSNDQVARRERPEHVDLFRSFDSPWVGNLMEEMDGQGDLPDSQPFDPFFLAAAQRRQEPRRVTRIVQELMAAWFGAVQRREGNLGLGGIDEPSSAVGADQGAPQQEPASAVPAAPTPLSMPAYPPTNAGVRELFRSPDWMDEHVILSESQESGSALAVGMRQLGGGAQPRVSEGLASGRPLSNPSTASADHISSTDVDDSLLEEVTLQAPSLQGRSSSFQSIPLGNAAPTANSHYQNWMQQDMLGSGRAPEGTFEPRSDSSGGRASQQVHTSLRVGHFTDAGGYANPGYTAWHQLAPTGQLEPTEIWQSEPSHGQGSPIQGTQRRRIMDSDLQPGLTVGQDSAEVQAQRYIEAYSAMPDSSGMRELVPADMRQLLDSIAGDDGDRAGGANERVRRISQEQQEQALSEVLETRARFWEARLAAQAFGGTDISESIAWAMPNEMSDLVEDRTLGGGVPVSADAPLGWPAFSDAPRAQPASLPSAAPGMGPAPDTVTAGWPASVDIDAPLGAPSFLLPSSLRHHRRDQCPDADMCALHFHSTEWPPPVAAAAPAHGTYTHRSRDADGLQMQSSGLPHCRDAVGNSVLSGDTPPGREASPSTSMVFAESGQNAMPVLPMCESSDSPLSRVMSVLPVHAREQQDPGEGLAMHVPHAVLVGFLGLEEAEDGQRPSSNNLNNSSRSNVNGKSIVDDQTNAHTSSINNNCTGNGHWGVIVGGRRCRPPHSRRRVARMLNEEAALARGGDSRYADREERASCLRRRARAEFESGR